MKEKYYIAYGSNLNIRQMKLRCPDAKMVGTSTIDGYQLLFKGSKTGAYLTIEKKPGASVPVGIWKVSEKDERALDIYEGFPSFYYKKWLRLAVKALGGKQTKELVCFVYIMHEERKVSIPTRYYVNTCLEGYRDFNFDPDYLQEAINVSWEAVNNEEGN